MADPSDPRKGAVEHEVGGGIGGWTQLAFDLASRGQFQHSQIIIPQARIGDAAGLDHHEASARVQAADISPGQTDKTGGRKAQIGFEDLLFQLMEHRDGTGQGALSSG